MRCFFEFIPWKKVIVRGCHLLLVFGVIASLTFQPSGRFAFSSSSSRIVHFALHSDLHTALYDQPNYFYCFAYGLLVYSSLLFYFMTCYVDPGYVPYRRVRRSFTSVVRRDVNGMTTFRYQIGLDRWLKVRTKRTKALKGNE